MVGHVPREISRVCEYVMVYGGGLDATVANTSFRRSPIPHGGLEIPTFLRVKNQALPSVYEKMKLFVCKYYTEPNDIPSKNNDDDIMEI